ncbi:MAG: glycerol kinase [Pseudomonadota bacterium]|nr:glycerol kinase [Pseudomonadota bacterium]
MKKISTSALAKKWGLNSRDVFIKLNEIGYLNTEDGKHVLADLGNQAGGEYKESSKFGTYIVWPETIDIGLSAKEPEPESSSSASITSTNIGKSFDLSAVKINFILSEIGWVKKGLKGWVLTAQGEKQGGIQAENYQSGVPYVRWPESILSSKVLINTVNQVKGAETEERPPEPTSDPSMEFREKFEAKHRSADGHMVRSKAEMLIDNWLYMAEIVHAYERKLPIEEDVYSDFYIPTGKVYIEYWGYEDEPKYLARKKKKQELYAKYGFNLIELNDSDVQNLDDVLPRMLLKFGVQAY